MNLVFEESGDFKTGSVLSQVGEAFQVELVGGKRTKVRAKDVVLQYTDDAPSHLMEKAKEIAKDMDLDFLWEVAGTEEFHFTDLSAEYFGHTPSSSEAVALLLTIHQAPMYFYKKGKGQYKAAPEKALKAALAGLEKKRQQALLQEEYVKSLKEGISPLAISENAFSLLVKPDKNSVIYKALTQAALELQMTPEMLLLNTGAISSPLALHQRRFEYEHFPKGVGFDLPEKDFTLPDLPFSDVKAFSIDDISTTEIDDAISVSEIDNVYQIGIHIAAPSLGIIPGDEMDQIARQRLSTVYMPGDKITMLPDAYVKAFTLEAGQTKQTVSLYAKVSKETFEVLETFSRLETIFIHDNLRHNDLESVVTVENLNAKQGNYPYQQDIEVLWQFSQNLHQKRMQKRESFGLKPTIFHQPDYNFYIEEGFVTIEERKRDAPLDVIVAELMIFANSTWAAFLQEHQVPGIYRTQGEGTSWHAKRLVKMVTHAAPHQGLGVDQYAWCTSPIRRYTDLVNQWQLLACLEHGVSAPLFAPFKPNDADLFAIISRFESAYTTYSEFQAQMERFWCLRWLAQQNVKQAKAVVVREEWVRLCDIPLMISLVSAKNYARATELTLDILSYDEVTLLVEARIVEGSAVLNQEAQDDEIEE